MSNFNIYIRYKLILYRYHIGGEKMKSVLVILALAAGIVTYIVAGNGACTKCSCTHFVLKSKYHGSGHGPHDYCKCGHFRSSHR